ncbi:MAG: hypothetical protein N4A47_00560 [Clostridia bacterium]|jgi:hypothetical protein|nr:hypothetical protein [Clostridia bacterium]
MDLSITLGLLPAVVLIFGVVFIIVRTLKATFGNLNLEIYMLFTIIISIIVMFYDNIAAFINSLPQK